MNFDLTEEQKSIRETVRRFAENEVAPRAEELDRTGEFPYDLVKKCGGIGLTGLLFPESVGGSDADTVSWCLGIEELSRADMSLGTTIFVSCVNGRLTYEKAPPDKMQEWITPVALGEGLASFGLTEPDAGSDNRSIRTTAFRDGDEVVINGTKCFITNAGTKISKFTNVIAQMDPTPEGKKQFGIVVVPTGTPGFSVSKKYRKMGWRSSDTTELSFEDCRVPVTNIIAAPGDGLRHAFALLTLGRISLASSSIGLAQACFDASMKYSQERVQFNKPIASFQRVQDMLVEMMVGIDAARLLTLKAAVLRDQGRKYQTEASVAKLYATEVGKRSADLAVQIHGGYGYMDEYAVSRYYRDIRIATIGDGTSEIQRMILARALGCPA